MNTNHSSNSATVRPLSTRFSTEIEGEGAELFLRGLLMACLLVALTFSGLGAGHRAPAPTNVQTAVALAKPAAAAPTDAPVAKL